MRGFLKWFWLLKRSTRRDRYILWGQFFFFFFSFFVERVLAIPPPIFARFSIVLEPIEPCWESNRTCQPNPGRVKIPEEWGEAPIHRVGKELPGFGMKFAPSHEGVSTLDQQATPAVLRPIHTGIGFVLECRADPAGGTRYYASSGVNEEGTEPQCWPLGEGGTRSLLSPQTTFRCSPESSHQWPLGIQELRQ